MCRFRALLALLLYLALRLAAEPPGPPDEGGPGASPMTGPEIKLVARFDADHDGRLNDEERKAARAYIVAERRKAAEAAAARGPGRGGGRGSRRGERNDSGLHGQVNVRGNNSGVGGGAGVGWSGEVGGIPANLGINVPVGRGGGGGGGGGDRASPRSGRDGDSRSGVPGAPGEGPGPRQRAKVLVQPGEKIVPADVAVFPGAKVYAPDVLRTYFLEFADADWEQELEDFHNTDVEVPARLTIDGQVFEGVGVHFRGASSFFTVQAGLKRSLNVSLDYTDPKAAFHGVRTLNLLNSHEDPTFLRTILYFDIARTYLPAPQANHARVVINGENWGVYVNVEQFNKDFVREWFGSDKGARWKVRGNPGGGAGLAYLGEDPDDYRRAYELKSKEDPAAWAKFVRLCRALDRSPADDLPGELDGLLDVDGALRFLALENVMINHDGYWIRASDYSLVLDGRGVFHVIPHDVNETFLPVPRGGPGFGGPPGGGPEGGDDPGSALKVGRAVSGRQQPLRTSSAGSVGSRWAAPPPEEPAGGGDMPSDFPGGPAFPAAFNLDPLHGLNEHSKPLRTKRLAVPAYREKYLRYVREIATIWLDWGKLGPIAAGYHAALAADVKRDTRKLDSLDAFTAGLDGDPGQLPRRGPTNAVSLREFCEKRRAYLLEENPDLKALK